MTRKTGWRKFGSKGVVLLLSLLLLIGLAGGAFAQTEQPLENYATSIKAELKANAQGADLPQYVENGQSLFFELQISNFKSQELVTYLKNNPEVDFTIPLNFTGHIEGNYPNKINPDDFDNVAYAGGKPLFRWWIDEDSGVIRVRFDENWINNASNNTVVENVELGFDGSLNVADKGVDGKLVFKAANDSFPLQMKTGYTITKTAGKPVYRDGQYVVDFTVKLTLDQKMNIVGTAGYDGYAALLTLDDTLNANSAMTGEIVDGPSITGANGLTVTAAKNGTANTFSFGGVTELNKGTYTIQFTMKLDGNAAAAKLEGYDKQNTVELKENNASLAKPVKADVSIAWDADVSNQFKVDKAILPRSSTTNVYISGKDYYVDYVVAVYLKNEFTSFKVVDQIISNAAHSSDMVPTLLGVNTAEGFWNSTAKNVPDNLTQMGADVIHTISGSDRTITVSAPAGDMLPAGAYYLKVPVKVTDSVKALAEAAKEKISSNQTQNVTVVYKNKAVLDKVDDDSNVNESSKEVTDTLRAPANFIKRGAIETDSSGTHTIYDKGGLRGKLIRWDVEFSWTIPDKYTVLTDTMKGGQVLLANGSTSFDIWDMSSGKPVEITKLWNKNDRDFITFGTDANGNETFTFYPGRLSDDPSLSTRKFKLTYYTLVPEDTVDFTGMKNNWNISYPNPDTGVAIGPVPGEETPIMGDTVKLTMSKVAKDTAYDVHDMYLRWTVTINNSNKIPMSALGDLKLTEDVDLTKKDGVLKDVDFNVWFDPTSRAPELVMYYGASSTITLERGVHYSVAVSAEDDSIMVIDFNEAAMAASLAEVGADRFNKIIMTVYTFNTDYNNVGEHTNSTYPRAHIKNTAKLDYATSGMKQDTIESSFTRGREFTTGMKRTAPLDGEWFADYDNDGEKELRWQLEIGSGSFPKMTAIIKAVDTLPEGQKLKYEGSEWKKNFKVYLKSTNDAIMDVPLADDAFSINGDTFELTVNKTQNVNNYYNIFIEYYTVFEDGALQDALEKAGADANDITVALNNQATLYLDGILLQETDITPDLTINNLAVDKRAKFLQSSGSKVNYTIEMNPYGLDMADGDVILLKDSMGNGKDVFSYIPSSFKLINQDTGAQMSPSSAASSTTYVLKMAEDGKSFELDVPDNTHLKLTYQVKTTQPVGTQGVSLENSASLAGRKSKTEPITFNVSSAYQSGSFSVLPDEAGIRLVKISSEGADSDAPTFLSDAEFTVTRLDAAFQPVGTVQTMTTDEKGLIEIKEKLTDVLYVVVEETKAPEGYRLGSAPWKWCYALVPANKSLSDADMAKLKETVHCDVTVISAGSYVEDSITNDPMTLKVRKVDAAGNLLDGAKFTLKKGDAAINPDSTYNVTGELLFKSLKAGNYTLEETAAPEGYAVPEECPWKFTLDENGGVKLAGDYQYISLSEDGLYLVVLNEDEATCSVQLCAVKMLDGKGAQKDAFTFTLSENGTVVETVQNMADGTVQFAPIEYDLDDKGKNYTYVIHEEAGDDSTIIYDTREYWVAVMVKDDGKGGLTAEVTYQTDDGQPPVFENETKPGSLSVSKQISGATPLATLQTFTVEVAFTDDSLNPWAGINGKVNVEGGDPITLENGKAAFTLMGGDTVILTDIPAGISYEARETGSLPGWTMDGTVKEGKIQATVMDEITFENIYAAKGDAVPEAVKVLVGRTIKEGEFTFGLYDADGNLIDTASTEAVTGKVVFDKITYTKPDLYSYTIKEIIPDEQDDTVEYSDEVINVIITVMDEEGKGELTHAIGYAVDGVESNTITNKYKADGSVQFEGAKSLTGATLQDGQFSFTLTGDGVNETVKNDANGQFKFSKIEYTLDDVGEHTYTVTEVNDGKTGYTYDDTEYEIVVNVADAGDGTLNVTYTVNGTENGNIAFANKYKADGSVQFEGAKTLTGTDLQADQFSFTLTGDGVNETVKNDANGKFKFSKIEYTLADVGEHTYTVTEVNDAKPGYTYDATEYKIIVTVTDAGDGTLNVTYTVNGTESGNIAFANKYKADGSVQFEGAKSLTGATLQDGQFSFTLTGDGENETVKNDANGKFKFSEIEYTLADVGEHTYTVTEVNDGKTGYTYDGTEYEIVVNVADAGDGTLNVTYTVNGKADTKIVFANTYNAAGSFQIYGEKQVDGKEPKESEIFAFTLKDADGNALQTVKNEEGLITFAPMAYTLADSGKTFVFTVEETTESDAAYETDDRVYTLSVTVTDDGKGGMTPAWTLTCDGEEAERMVFNNKRLGSLTIEKTVVGGDAEKAFVFKVTLADADGKELNGTYPVTGADVSSIASGEYLHLKNGEKAEITYLPMGTKYMVEEDEYKAYETTANGEAGRIAQGVIGEEAAMVSYVNTEKTVSFSVTKEWQGGDGGSIQLTLYGNGEKLNPQPSYERNGNVYTYQNLPQYTKDGKGIVYAAKEKFMDGYMTIYMNKAPFTQETDMIYDGGTIINRAVTDFRVKKVWEGLAEGEEMPEITLVLYCNGEVMDKKTPKSDENGWYIYHNLPITKNGEAARYSVVEEALDGFTVTYGEDTEATCATNGDTIVNRKIPKTGDDSRIGLWLAVTAVSAAGCILLLKKRREA